MKIKNCQENADRIIFLAKQNKQDCVVFKT